MSKIYYHITRNLRHDGHFIPRVPKHTLIEEENTTKRICVSESIVGCIAAFPYIESLVDEELSDYLKVFEIHLDEVGLNNEDVIEAEELYISGKVDDSLVTKEAWLLKSFEIPEHRQYIIRVPWIESFIWNAIPYKVAKDIFSKNKEEILVGDLIENLNSRDLYDRITCFYEENLHNEYHKKGIRFSTTHGIECETIPSTLRKETKLYFASKHYTQLIPYIQKHYPLAKMDIWTGSIDVTFPSNADLLPLYLYDYSFYESEERASIGLTG